MSQPAHNAKLLPSILHINARCIKSYAIDNREDMERIRTEQTDRVISLRLHKST